MVHALGGPRDVVERPRAHLARAPYIGVVEAPNPGFVTAIDVRALGLAVVHSAADAALQAPPSIRL